MSVEVDQTVEIRDSTGKLCGTYHYQDPFKSFLEACTHRMASTL
jgi:hypothetical protein